jgi:RimJ/RimL family protein N-acetyltransferase
VLRAIQAGAEKCRGHIKLSVDRQNLPAKRLYHRLGFQVAGISDTHESMTWSPSIRYCQGWRQAIFHNTTFKE